MTSRRSYPGIYEVLKYTYINYGGIESGISQFAEDNLNELIRNYGERNLKLVDSFIILNGKKSLKDYLIERGVDVDRIKKKIHALYEYSDDMISYIEDIMKQEIGELLTGVEDTIADDMPKIISRATKDKMFDYTFKVIYSIEL